jgi:PAS domain S-box-containing protein
MPNRELVLGIGSVALVVLFNGPVPMALFSILLILARQRLDSAQLQASVLRTAMDGYWLTDLQGRLREANAAYCHMSGYSRQELLARRIVDLEVQMSERQIEDRMAAIIKKGGQRFESCHRRKDGSTFDADVSVQYLAVDGGCYVCFIRDITERKRAEMALRESEELYRTLIETTGTGYVTLDLNGKVCDSNPEYVRFTGHARVNEILGRSVIEWTAPNDQGKNRDAVARCLRDGYIRNFEVDYLHGSGNIIPVEINASVVGQGDARRIITLCRDITERRKAEEALRNLSGRLIQAQDDEQRRIAHELHDTTAQALVALLMNLTRLRDLNGSISEESRRLLTESLQLTEQSCRELRTVSYLLYPPMLDEVGLASAIRWFADGFSERSQIRVSVDLPAEMPRLPRPAEMALFRVLQQALANVARHSGSPSAEVRLAWSAPEVALEVRDQGQGMSPETLKKVRAGLGGLGIAGMRERLRQFGGRLEISSGAGGTRVCAFLRNL